MKIKRHPLAKQRCSFLSSSISMRGYVCVIRSILVSCTSSYTVTGTLCVVLKGKTGGWPRYTSLSCHEACKRSIILKLRSWRSRGKVMQEILKFSGYTLWTIHAFAENKTYFMYARYIAFKLLLMILSLTMAY